MTLIVLSSAIQSPAIAQTVAPPSPALGNAVSPEAWQLYSQGHTAQSRNDLSTALDRLNQAISLSPKLYLAYMDRGIVYFKMQQFDLAAKDFSEAIVLGNTAPGLQFGYKLLGICYRKLNRPADAIRTYTIYIDGPGGNDWDGINQRAEAYAQADDMTNARRDFERALQLSPNNPKVLGSLTVSDAKAEDWVHAFADSTRWLAVEPGQRTASIIQTAARQHLGKN
ncbi:tetratricopeptide repeat protein [uncultured Sphingomonas sp.]|uniref:tetratricopeptide repeat protein n=1 Tax=uncultured Sphingomonas sp. TaxID=158754 RepID=UPI0035CA878D